MLLKPLWQLAKMTSGQNLSLNLGQNLTHEMATIGPEPGLIYMYMYTCSFCSGKCQNRSYGGNVAWFNTVCPGVMSRRNVHLRVQFCLTKAPVSEVCQPMGDSGDAKAGGRRKSVLKSNIHMFAPFQNLRSYSSLCLIKWVCCPIMGHDMTKTLLGIRPHFNLNVTSVYLNFTSCQPLFYLVFIPAQPAISNHGLETKVYRPLAKDLRGFFAMRALTSLLSKR